MLVECFSDQWLEIFEVHDAHILNTFLHTNNSFVTLRLGWPAYNPHVIYPGYISCFLLWIIRVQYFRWGGGGSIPNDVHAFPVEIYRWEQLFIIYFSLFRPADQPGGWAGQPQFQPPRHVCPGTACCFPANTSFFLTPKVAGFQEKLCKRTSKKFPAHQKKLRSAERCRRCILGLMYSANIKA